MKLLFATDGFPGAEGTKSGSGIGTYLACLTRGLIDEGHECHVLTWGLPAAPVSQVIGGVHVHLVGRGYWRLRDRLLPGWHDVSARRAAVRALDRVHRFDWIEVESDEGVDIGIQRDFPDRCLLRVHTTLTQMVDYKKVARTWSTRSYLSRERRSVRLARHVVVSTSEHGTELLRLFPGMKRPSVLPLGAADGDLGVRRTSEGAIPEFLVVGTPDLRKGFDRIRPVLESYASRHGACRCALVSACPQTLRAEFGLMPPFPDGIEVRWYEGLDDVEMSRRFEQASVVLHLARYESYGYPPLEAAARSVPVVATRTGIAPDLLRGDLATLLVDGDDPVDCSRALSLAVKDAGRIGRELRARYDREHSREIALGRYLGYLKGLEARRGRPRAKSLASEKPADRP